MNAKPETDTETDATVSAIRPIPFPPTKKSLRGARSSRGPNADADDDSEVENAHRDHRWPRRARQRDLEQLR